MTGLSECQNMESLIRRGESKGWIDTKAKSGFELANKRFERFADELDNYGSG